VAGWVTVAQGTTFEMLGQARPADVELPKGTPIRVVMELSQPVAFAFNMAGAEAIFRPAMPDGMELVDVHSAGLSTVVVEMRADPAWLLPLVAFVAVRWVGLSLAAIGLMVALGFLIAVVKVEAPEELFEALAAPKKWIALALIAVAAIVGLRALGKARGR